MKRILGIIAGIIALGLVSYFAFIYYVPYSEGIRSGELIKLSHKGIAMKTWEGELSQGISGAQIFSFSVLDSDAKVIEDFKRIARPLCKTNLCRALQNVFLVGRNPLFHHLRPC